MKKKLLILTILALALSVLFISCGDKAVVGISIVDGTFDREYELGETVDYSRIQAEVTYNDGEVITVDKEELELGSVDTSSVGTKKFTVTYGGYTLTIDVLVKSSAADDTTPPAPTLSSISIDTSSVASKVFVGQALDTSAIKVNATYSDNSVKAIALADLTVSSVDTATAGNKTLTVTYGGKTAELTVAVIGVKAIEMMNLATEIFVGEALDTASAKAVVTYTDDTVAIIDSAKLTFSSFSSATAGTAVLKVTYLDYTADVDITVKALAEVIGIEVDANSLGNLVVVADGVLLDMNAIKAAIVVNAVYGYADGTITRREVIADKTALGFAEANEAGKRYLVVTYGNFNAKVLVTETAPIVTSIEINEAKLNKAVILNGVYVPGAFEVTAHYSNDTHSTVAYGAGTAITVSAIDTATAGEKTLTVTYEGKTDTATVYVLDIHSITVVDAPTLKVKVGESLTVPALKILATYKNDSYTLSETVDVTNAMIGAIDTATAGDKTFTVTYLLKETTVAYTVIGVKSVAIDGDSIETTVAKGGTLKTDGIKALVTYTDGSTVNVDKDELTVDTSAIDLFNAGTYTLKVTYKGVEGTIEILVDDRGYTILGVTLPDSYLSLESKKNKFMNKNSNRGYVVGDDNPFYFTLQLSVLDSNDNEVTITNYTSVSYVYLIEGATETLLTGDQISYYVDIDESKNAFDFTEHAVGKTFRIASRPGFGISASNYGKYTKSIVVNVKDAYNVYSAKELHVMVNFSDNDDLLVGEIPTKQFDIVKQFLNENGIKHPGEIAGVVLHNDIKITTDDLPAPYLKETGKDNYGNPIYRLEDYVAVYSHATSLNNPTFDFYGNHFTIYSYGVPAVVATADAGVSHSTLFTFGNLDGFRDGSVANFDNSPYATNIYDLYIIDDDPNDPQNADSVRSKLGLIGMKVQHQHVTVDNFIAERYYISFFADRDYLTVNMNNANLYNAWQNHIFLWSHNDLQSKDDEIAANHYPVTMNITESDINTCGGPVIISQTKSPTENRNLKSGAIVNIDEATEIWTYVNSSAIWFDAFGASQQAADIQALSALFSTHGKSFVVKDPVDPNNGLQYHGDFMNIVMLNMPASSSLEEIMAPDRVQGSLTIGDTKVLDMGIGKNAGYEALIATLWQMAAVAEKFPPAFQSSASGTDEIIWTNGDLLLHPDIQMVGGQPVATPVSTDTPSTVLDGEYLNIFYASMGLVMGNYHEVETATN
ncbi:MAG: bacterial Ig-like domain-containing protein [Clostridia bacterium]|nr:bacterial Ig-like domain-containing protein [Clostridia bacterium]